MVGDLVVDVPPDSQVHRQVVRKDADARAIELDPVVKLHYVEVRPPDMADPAGDLQRLRESLEREWGLTGLDCDPHVLAALQSRLREGAWTATVAVHDGEVITDLWAGYPRRRPRRCLRRRVDDGGGASVRSGDRATCSHRPGR